MPEGTLPVAIGLIVTGLSAYGFLSLTRYGLGTDASTPVNQLWFATFILAPGFFLPVEQEVGRALAHRRALGQGGLPVLRKAALLALGLLAIVGIFLLSISPFLTRSCSTAAGCCSAACSWPSPATPSATSCGARWPAPGASGSTGCSWARTA